MKDRLENIMVSVVMPTYNHEKYIGQAIEGVLMQETDFIFELIIVEDYSTDDTRKIALEYANKHPKIINVLDSEKNLGITDNYLRAMSAITGKYIALCEGDDYWTDPLKLQKQVDFIESNPDCSLCFHPVKLVFFNSEQKDFVLGSKIDRNHVFSSEEIIGGILVRTVSMLLKTEVIQDLTQWVRGAPLDDLAIQLHCASKGNVGYLGGKPMAVYNRGVPGSWSEDEYSQDIEQSKKWYTKRFEDHILVFTMFNNYTKQQFNHQIQNRIKKYSIHYMSYMLPISSRKEQVKIIYEKKQYLKYFRIKPLGYIFLRLVFGERILQRLTQNNRS